MNVTLWSQNFRTAVREDIFLETLRQPKRALAMVSSNVLFFVFVSVVFNHDFGSSNSTTDQQITGSCAVQQICHGGPSPQEFSELVSLVKERRKKLDVMEAKLDAVCSGECSLKRDKAQTNRY